MHALAAFLFTPFVLRTSISLVFAVVLLTVLAYFVIGPAIKGTVPIANFISYNITVFVVLGFAVTIAAADKWPAACLWAGAAMFSGGVLGILFGLPTAADAVNTQAAQATSEANTAQAVAAAQSNTPPPTPATPPRTHTLLADTAGFLSKFLAGAGLAQAHNILNFFENLSRSVAGYILTSGVPHAPVAAGGLLLYFGLIGFLSGIILPYFFLKNFP